MAITNADLDRAESKIVDYLKRKGTGLSAACTLSGLDYAEVIELLDQYDEDKAKGVPFTRIGERLHKIIAQGRAENQSFLTGIMMRSAAGYATPTSVKTKDAATGKTVIVKTKAQFVPADPNAAKWLLERMHAEEFGKDAVGLRRRKKVAEIDPRITSPGLDDAILKVLEDDDEEE